MGSAFKKDGAGTFIVEMIPGGGLITAPFHLVAGNHAHAAAAVAGAVLDFAIPGGGGAIAKAAMAGGRRAVVKAVVGGGGKALIKETVKDGIKKRPNGIHKHHRK